jgi:L-ribulokinase
VEHCDWFPALLTATESFGTIKRSRCAAGHKVMWHTAWGGYPSAEFLNTVAPVLVHRTRES